MQAWLRASVPDVDLQVTVSEVRPDGKETYVQSGYLRASIRQLDRVRARPSTRSSACAGGDVAKLPKGRFSKLIIPLYYEGHVYRAGSRIRVTVSAPVGDQPVWAFARPSRRAQRQGDRRLSHKRPSRLILPFVPGIRRRRRCRPARACAASPAGRSAASAAQRSDAEVENQLDRKGRLRDIASMHPLASAARTTD